MTKRMAGLTGTILLVSGIAAFTGSALAGNGHGSGNGYGNGQAAAPIAPASEPASEGSAPGNSANAPGQNKTHKSKGGGSAGQNAGGQAGVKPTNATSKNTSCTTGGSGSAVTCTPTSPNAAAAGKADASKRYGNGKTAAQTAAQNGAPAGTVLYGPGNSQPHKAALCPGSKHKVDVHALKAKDRKKACGATSASKPAKQSTPSTNVASAAGASVRAPVSTGGPSAQGGVLGATESGAQPVGGVLGAIEAVGQGILPFTGFSLWVVVLVAVALIALGLALRRRAGATG